VYGGAVTKQMTINAIGAGKTTILSIATPIIFLFQCRKHKDNYGLLWISLLIF
jgi:hypothetical protein